MVALSTLMRFVQEARSQRAAEALRSRVGNKATVLRRAAAARGAPPHEVELPVEQLVPGDVLRLAAGDIVPADLRLLAAKDLFVNQSAMTGVAAGGEVGRAAAGGARRRARLPQPVLHGDARRQRLGDRALVVGTGRATFGIAGRARDARRDRADGVPDRHQPISWLLIRFMLAMVPVVFVINGATKGDWLQALLFALSIAVGLTPEMLR